MSATEKQIRTAITAVINYNWHDEEADYYENCSDEPGGNQRAGHIFESLRLLRSWLGSEDEDEDEDEAPGPPDVLVTNFELLRALDGHDQVFATSDGGQVRLRLYSVDELLTAQREAAASLPGPDPGMSREQAIDLCRPVSLRELAQRLRND